MYPVSATYKTAIAQNVRDVRITGSITLKDESVINITDADIVQGSLYITEQCVSGEDIEVGNVYASEMGLALSTPLENPYSLDGARVLLHFGINTGSLWETVPLGYFYVTDIARKATAINLTALDGMILFDIPVGDPGSSSPRNFVTYACSQAGVTLETSVSEIDSFASAGVLLAAPDPTKIKTCRDLLMWACQIMGSFARMNRQGRLEIIPIKAKASVKTINKAERFNSEVSDFAVKITKVSIQVEGVEYSRGSEGMTMVLGENPLMAGLSEAQVNQILDYLLAQITTVVYVPFNSGFVGDPALQPGDFVTLAGTGVLGGGDVVSMITHSSWRYRGSHDLKGSGKYGLTRGVENQQIKTVLSIAAMAKSTQDLALAINQSTQLIKDAIGGHVLIRQNPNETNEILIMDHPDPEQATKIWRWNMGGLGYSDNVTGADNPLREYDIAITMDGAINANFIKTGVLDAGVVTIGTATKFADGYNPSEKGRVFRSQPTPPYTIGDLWTEGASGHLRVCKVAKTTGQSYATSDWELATKYTDDSAFEAFIASKYAEDLADLQNQIDGSITTWFYDYAPTLSNAPAVNWTTDTVKDEHIGDLFYDTNVSSGHGYRFAKVSGAYQWIQISDSDVTAALANAAAAQDTADKKRRVFTAQPYGPYDVGDLWAAGSTGDLKRCKTATSTTNYFNAADWELASKYTDDTLAKTKAKTFYQAGIPTAVSAGDFWIDSDDNNKLYRASVAGANEIKAGEWILVRDSGIQAALDNAAQAISDAAAAQGTADGKVTTFFQTTAPTAEGEGDLWLDTDDGNKLYRWNGTSWVAAQDAGISQAINAAADAQSTADSKIVTFYQASTPTAAAAGDLWVDTDDNNKLYRWNGSVWQTARDATIAIAQTTANNAASAASTAQTSANTANTLLADIANDNKLTPLEKQETKKEWDVIVAEKPTIESQATTYSVTTEKTNYATAYDALNTYITPLLSNLTTTSDITGTDFRARFKDYYDKRTTLLKKISDIAKSLADAAQATASVKRRVFTTTPTTPYEIGDLWTGGPSGDLKKCKVTRLTGDYTASDWELASKYTDDSVAQQALAAASNAQETADGFIQSFFQASAPTSGMSFGDIWIDSDGHTPPNTADIYRYEDIDGGSQGTLAWRAAPTSAIGKVYLDAYNAQNAASAAQSTANSKIKTYYQDEAPSSGLVTGDLWVDTNDNNQLYRWNGSAWISARDQAMITAGMGVDANCTALFHFDGSLKSHKGLDATFTRASPAYLSDGTLVESGVPRFEEGRFGQGIMVEEGTTNLATAGHRNIESLTGISIISGSPTISISGDWSYIGTKSLKVVGSDNNSRIRIYDAISRSDTSSRLTYSAYIYNPNSTPITVYGANYIVGNVTIPPYSVGRLEITTPAGVAWATINEHIYEVSGKTFYLDAVQIEEKPYPTSFVDGTRVLELLTIPSTAEIINASEGTISMWLCPIIYKYGAVLYTSGLNDDTFWLALENSGAFGFFVGAGSGNSRINLRSTYVLPKNSFTFITVTWDSNGTKMFINGVKHKESASFTPNINTTKNITIGFNNDAWNANFILDDLRIDNVCRTDDEIRSWYNAQAPFYAVEELTTFVNGVYAADKYSLQSQIDGKIETWFQATDPNTWPEADRIKHTGDMWYSSSTKLLKRYDGANNTWTTIEDQKAIDAYAAAGNAQTTANSRITTFYGSSIPTALAAGDLWIHSGNGNKLYRAAAAGANEIKTGEWELVRDSGIEAALAAAAGAQETADGKIMTYYQTTMPATGSLGDLWFDTDDNKKLYRHNGTTFVAADDTRIAQAITAAAGAQATADGKVTTFYQNDPPTAEGIGDLWVDTNDGNKLYRWNGSSWIGVQDEAMFKASMGVDADCVGLWHFDGSLNSHKGVAAMAVANFDTGCFGQAVMVGGGTTNLVTNGDFSNGTTDWSSLTEPAHITQTIITENGKTFNHVTCMVTDDNIFPGIQQTGIAVSPDTLYTLSALGYCGGNSDTYIMVMDNNGDILVYTQMTLTRELSPGVVSHTFTTSADTTFVSIWVVWGDEASSSNWFKVTDIQLEQKAVLKIPTAGMSASQGTISFRISNLSTLDTYETLLELPDSSNSTCFILWIDVNNRLCLTYKRNDSLIVAIQGPFISSFNNWDLISLSWGSSRLSLSINDAEVGFAIDHLLPSEFWNCIYIGSDRFGDDAVNAILIDELRIDKVYRDVATRTGWHKTGVPFYTSEDMKQWPGYIRAETDGLKVYDSENALRVLVGSWLRDQIRKYGIKIIDGEIYSSLIRTGQEGDARYIAFEPPNSLVVYAPKTIGSTTPVKVLHMASPNVADKVGLDFYDADGTLFAQLQAQGSNKVFVLANAWGKLALVGHTGVDCSGDFRMTSGTKYNVEQTENYGQIGLAVRESPEQRYVDEGMGTLVNGECRINVDPIFLECIEPHTPDSRWYIQLTPYADVDLYVAEIGDGYFVVKERNGGTTTGAEFTWSLSATRKDYAMIRFMEVLD